MSDEMKATMKRKLPRSRSESNQLRRPSSATNDVYGTIFGVTRNFEMVPVFENAPFNTGPANPKTGKIAGEEYYPIPKNVVGFQSETPGWAIKPTGSGVSSLYTFDHKDSGRGNLSEGNLDHQGTQKPRRNDTRRIFQDLPSAVNYVRERLGESTSEEFVGFAGNIANVFASVVREASTYEENKSGKTEESKKHLEGLLRADHRIAGGQSDEGRTERGLFTGLNLFNYVQMREFSKPSREKIDMLRKSLGIYDKAIQTFDPDNKPGMIIERFKVATRKYSLIDTLIARMHNNIEAETGNVVRERYEIEDELNTAEQSYQRVEKRINNVNDAVQKLNGLFGAGNQIPTHLTTEAKVEYLQEEFARRAEEAYTLSAFVFESTPYFLEQDHNLLRNMELVNDMAYAVLVSQGKREELAKNPSTVVVVGRKNNYQFKDLKA